MALTPIFLNSIEHLAVSFLKRIEREAGANPTIF
jgi:hypothetical protein